MSKIWITIRLNYKQTTRTMVRTRRIGFFLLEARDFNEAIQIAAKWPSARIGAIEVRPIEETLPLDRRYK